jgi:hypothetical protein
VISGSDTGRYVKVSWGSAASGKITITIKNKFGCSADISLNVNLIAAPAKPALAGPDTVCLNQTSIFTTPNLQPKYTVSAVGGTVLSAGVNGTSYQIKVLWNKPGKGSVITFGTNSVGCNSAIDTFNVFVSSPAGSGIIGPVSVCPNNKGILYSLDKKYYKASYSWTATGATASRNISDTLFSVDWGGLGTGTLRVIVTDRFGCVDTANLTVKKNHSLAGQAPTGPGNLCELATGIPYNVKPVKGESYAWTVSGGLVSGGSVGTSIKVNWGAAGSAWVGVISTAYDSVSKLPCLSPLMKLPVVLNGAPKLSPLNDVTYCQTKTPLGYWTAKNAGVKKYEYDFSGLKVTPTVSTDSLQWSLALSLDTFGSFPAKIRAISQTGCPGPWVTATITINPKPKSQLISGSSAVCVPNITGYSYSITGLPNSTFTWWVSG